jgi:Arylsulfotransferase (ASST)
VKSPGLLAALALVLAVGAPACDDDNEQTAAAPTPPSQHFRSRPDLRPPLVTTATPAEEDSGGYVFLAPKKEVAQAGPMILDGAGRVVWFNPLDTKGVADFRVQRYGGRPVLTWWRGKAEKGVGDGWYVLMDDTYRRIATVTAGNGLTGDIHEFLIGPDDTAWITVYRRIDRDLSEVGGPKNGTIFEGVVQNVDVATGRVLFEWHSADHVALTESYAPPPKPGQGRTPYDYFHINAVDVEPDGNLLVSARNTHAIYEIRPSDGRVLWRLGGKRSDFDMGPGTRFAWQHDARRRPDGTITLFDNGADPKVEEFSRVLRLRVDPEGGRATLVRSYAHPKRLLAGSQGNAQLLPGGHVFVGWGAQPWFTEFDGDGRVVLDARFGKGADSYRAYRFPWTGRPSGDPAIATARADGRLTVYASWNGSTLTRRWQVVAGPDANRLHVVATAGRTGFETAIPVETDEPYVRVRALDADGTVLGTSRAVRVSDAD